MRRLAITTIALVAAVSAPASSPGYREIQTQGLAELRCIEAAERSVRLDELQRRRLCRGAVSTAPALCFEAAVSRTFLDAFEAVRLCQGAVSLAPVECYERAVDDTQTDRTEALALCRASDPGPVVDPWPRL